MSKIRKLFCFDKKKALEMVSFLNNSAGDTYLNSIMFNPLILLHHLLPLSLKYLPESYVLKDKRDIKGLITIAPCSNPLKLEIKKLLFEENSFDEAAELVQYVVSRYKAMGATSVIVKVDDYLPELLSMFVSKCGFCQISYERLWRITKFPNCDYDKRCFRHFGNSDSNLIADLYNDSLLPHFRSILKKSASEFCDNIFKGLAYYSEYKYTILDEKRNIIGCIIINTADNENYVLDIIHTGWNSVDINSAIAFAVNKIRHRNKKFGLFIKSKKYTNTGENIENLFMNNHFECVQNQILLTNSSAKVLKTLEKSGNYTFIGDFLPSNPMTT